MLGTFLLAFRHDPRRKVPHPDRRFRLVDMLSPGTAGPEGVPLQISRVDLHFDFVVHHGMNKYRCKGRHPFALGIERTYTYQAMDTIFTLEHTKGIVSLDFQSGRFDTDHIAILAIEFDHLITAFFSVHHKHTHQHLRPVVRL